ncbi:helix-turn-helix domain-containing protein [uncultured Mailhella sp.]|uniref:winged helix-turn-helix transcriptional regulator n=1 Tax=uncultured Mailhella sp. TaxID=1981031 RepID=UPI002612FABC|nr:helix-turn-helix domain-containing protein [uncultured Mailhella sp.]
MAKRTAETEGAGTHCPVEATLGLIGGKYKALILWKLMAGTLRFSALRRAVPAATPKMLTQQLRELEEDGLVERTVYPVVPPRVEYALTSFGRSIRPVLASMYDWGSGYLRRRGLEVNCSMQPLPAEDMEAEDMDAALGKAMRKGAGENAGACCACGG